MHALHRKWLALGSGNDAEAASYDIALQTEGALGLQDNLAATVMSDVEKGFEKVTRTSHQTKSPHQLECQHSQPQTPDPGTAAEARVEARVLALCDRIRT